jgi:hypothetical protein
MDGKSRNVLIAAVVVLAVVAGASAALAMSQRSSGPSAAATPQTFMSNAVGQLGTQQQSAPPNVFGGTQSGPPSGAAGGCGGEAFLDVAASYIGTTTSKLKTQLDSGKSLAQVARANGKSVAGLKTAILNGIEKKLDAAVKDGDLTRAQANQILADKRANIDDIVNRTKVDAPPAGAYQDGPPPGAPSFGGPPTGSTSVPQGPSL